MPSKLLKVKAQPTTFGGLSRSELMSRVRSRGNVTTELRLLHLLRDAGLTGWRRHISIPGCPDFGWLRLRVAVFVHGCFWHGHTCRRNLKPRSNVAEWCEKITRNRMRDIRLTRSLRRSGWSVITVWECQLQSAPEASIRRITRHLSLKENKRGREETL